MDVDGLFALFQSFLQHQDSGVLIETHHRTILSVNERFCELFCADASPEELVGKGTPDVFSKGGFAVDELKEYSRRMSEIIDEGKTVLGEEVRLRGGHVFERDYFPLSNNGLSGHLWMYRDVTERKRSDEQLHRRDTLMTETQHLVHLGSWDWDIQTNTVAWSDELYDIFGLKPNDIPPTYEAFLERVHPDDRGLVSETIEKAYGDHEPFTLYHRVVRPDGSVRFLQSRGIMVEDQSHKAHRLLWTGLDVTDSMQHKEALRQSMQKYEALVDAVDGIVWEADGESLHFTFISKQAEQLLKFPLGRWIQEPMFWKECVVPADRDRVAQEMRFAASRRERREVEFRMVTADGNTVWLRGIMVPVSETGLPPQVRGIFVDVTERKKAEAQLKESFEQLRNLAVRLQSIREEESTRIAMEIHDELGQALTGLKMDLAWMVKRLPNGQDVLVEKMGAMSKLIDATIHTVRRISTELRPGVLDDLGLVAAIEWQTDEFERRTGIRCTASLPSDSPTIDRDRSTAIFRIFQETLTNIARYANAKNVAITLKADEDTLVLEVKDDGVGIPTQKVNDPQSLGLVGMRERAVFVGAKLSIAGRPTRGTTVTLEVPLASTSA